LDVSDDLRAITFLNIGDSHNFNVGLQLK